MKAFVTGCSGFLGMNLCPRLLADGYEVVGYDRAATFPTGVPHALFGDILDTDMMARSMKGCVIVFHLAARADIRGNWDNPWEVWNLNANGTFSVLSAMRMAGVRRIVFASTGSVYGEKAPVPTPEYCPMPVQTSIYAASKLAGEALISAHAEAGHLDEAFIMRLASMMGPHYHHGHVIDFWRQLKDHPQHLDVLNDGTSRKSYVDVADVVDAMMTAVNSDIADKSAHRTAILNVGTMSTLSIRESAAAIASAMQMSPKFNFGNTVKGWVGDPLIVKPDCSTLRSLGWRPKYHPEMSVRRTVRWLEENAHAIHT